VTTQRRKIALLHLSNSQQERQPKTERTMAQYSSRSSVRGARERFSMTDIFKIKDY
jgi:hypothetical protein